MRIGVIGPQFADSFADNLVDSISRLGHEVVALGTTVPTWPTSLGVVVGDLVRKSTSVELKMQRGVIDRAREARCNLISSVEATMLPDSVENLQRDGSRVVLWFPDHVANLG